MEDAPPKQSRYLSPAFGMDANRSNRGLDLLNELIAKATSTFIEIPDLFFELVASFGQESVGPHHFLERARANTSSPSIAVVRPA
jgi:hypothetical protein